MSYATADFRDFLATATGRRVVTGYLPDLGEVAFVSPVPSPGLRMEGCADDRAYQVLSRGKADDYDGAEALAQAVDDAVLHAEFPTQTPSGEFVYAMRRLGAAPIPAPNTPDSGRRYEFVATYLVSVDTSL